MFPNVHEMDAATAETLAQIVPVLLLTLLFESRAKPKSPDQRALTVLVAFLGNLVIAVTAILLEFGLLAVVQVRDTVQQVEWLWWASMALFGLVLLRWASFSAARGVVQRAATPLATGFADGVVVGFSGVTSNATAAVTTIWEFEKSVFDNIEQIISYPASAVASASTAAFSEIAATAGSLSESITYFASKIAGLGRKDRR